MRTHTVSIVCNNRLRQIDYDLCAVERVQQILVAAAAVVKLASCISSVIITALACARVAD